MVKDHSDSERGNPPPPPHGLLFPTKYGIYFLCFEFRNYREFSVAKKRF